MGQGALQTLVRQHRSDPGQLKYETTVTKQTTRHAILKFTADDAVVPSKRYGATFWLLSDVLRWWSNISRQRAILYVSFLKARGSRPPKR
jgi:hypothetical protein